MMNKITYLIHDGFVVETATAVLVFDYWRGPRDTILHDDLIPRALRDIERSKPLYIFVSHFHKDHLDRRIFEWFAEFESVKYIISNDVRKHVKYLWSDTATYKGPKVPAESVVVLHPGESFSDDRLHVEAFASTDIGNSYYVECGGRNLFHAGDLNAWLWLDESTEQEINAAERAYLDIVDGIAKAHDRIDIVFFPVDARIGRGYWYGAKWWLERIQTGAFFAMHYGLAETERERDQYHARASCFELYANPRCEAYYALAPGSSLAII